MSNIPRRALVVSVFAGTDLAQWLASPAFASLRAKNSSSQAAFCKRLDFGQ